MKIGSHLLAGFQPDPRGRDALGLAAAVVRATGGAVTVAAVRPPAMEGATGTRADAEWDAYLDGQARAVLDGAAEIFHEVGLPETTKLDYVVTANRGSGRGLARLVGKTRADLIVIGSAPTGPRGAISVGSTADQLLHGSPVPVMAAPRGYAERAVESFDRITVAYLRRPGCTAAVEFAARAAAACGAPLRLLTVALGGGPKGKASGLAAEHLRRMVDSYGSDLAMAAREAAKRSPLAGDEVQTEVVQGPDVAAALGTTDWSPGELLVCSSSDAGPLHRVFVGDMSLKILRAVPCPALVLPRATR
jgi:nucleotide-binding universal stress UspA family protein